MILKTTIKTSERQQIIDITDYIRDAVKNKIQEGIGLLFVNHTSAAIILNECLDDTVLLDILETLEIIAPRDSKRYKHIHDNNADSHIKASILGSSVSLIIKKGDLYMGKYQRILFCEFDGPRKRSISISLISENTVKKG